MVEPKVVLHNPPHWDSHAAFYEGDHGIHYLTFLPSLEPLPLLTISKVDVGRDSILSPKTRHSLFGVYQTLKPTQSFSFKKVQEGTKEKWKKN